MAGEQQQLVPSQRQDGLVSRGLGPAARLPAGKNTFPTGGGAFGPLASPGTLASCPQGWTKDAIGTPGRRRDPVAAADNGLEERWGRGWLETRRTEGWGRACREARAAVAAVPVPSRPHHPQQLPEVGLRVGFRSHLKSLSLDVIFSSKLEMWYEALAMLPASIPPAGSVAAGARGRGSSSRWRRRPLPGSQRDTGWGRRFDTMSGPRPDRVGACPGGRGRGERESDGDGLTTELLAEQRAHGRRDGRLGLAGKPDTCARSGRLARTPSALAPQGKRPKPASFAGRAGAADAGRCGEAGSEFTEAVPSALRRRC